MNGVQRKAFSGPFCLGVTLKAGEAKGSQRDTKETANKCDGAKTRRWAGATPLFGPSVPKVPVRSLPPIGATYSAACFGPVATGRGKRTELEEEGESK